MRRRLGHAACLNHAEKYVQVPQPQAAADSALPIDGSSHRFSVISVKRNQAFSQYQNASSLAVKPPSQAACAETEARLMKLLRRNFLHLAAGAAALPVVPGIARAQIYPTRPARIVVG